MRRVFSQVAFELGLHAAPEHVEAGHFAEHLAVVFGQRHPQNPRRTGVAGTDAALTVEHQNTGREVVQNSLQVGARGIDLAHALLNGRAGVVELLGHVGKRAREAAQFVVAVQHRFGPQVAARHLAHAFGQQQQRPRQLRSQQHRQQHRAEDRQKQTQREGADVHLAQPAAGQRALLVFAVGFLHGNRVGHEVGRQVFGDLQKAVAAGQAEVGVTDQRQRADAGLGRGSACRPGQRVFKAFDLGGHPLAARQPELLRRGPVGLQDKARLAGAGDQLAGGAPEHQVFDADLLA